MDRKLIFEKQSLCKPPSYFGPDAVLLDVAAVLPAALLRQDLDLPRSYLLYWILAQVVLERCSSGFL